MDDAAFVARYRDLFEHSPWVVERALRRQPFDEVYRGLMQVVLEGSPEDQVALIRAHPELAGKAAIDRTLTEASAAEQASAGLDRLGESEFKRFHALNQAYRHRFGFSFVLCVLLHDKAGSLTALEQPLEASRTAEIATTIAEIGKIVHLRLEALPCAWPNSNAPSPATCNAWPTAAMPGCNRACIRPGTSTT
ncbi:2-oxo-4-hydroxy-4-carboxy-5-ureidoimidazoline decarboxylase [Xanthomonas oryzae]|nr:2-oxo-4-hydroxy-4-carboxy-5-ureidoimidazoline decarboxylase [Xanthomonas oryzae]